MDVNDRLWGEIILECCESLGVAASAEHLGIFRIHAALLLEWAGKMNLTAATDPEQIAKRHFADSLALAPHIPKGAKTLVDIGSGAGFPGLPVKVVRPDLAVTLVDSVRKKVSFQKAVIRATGLDGIEAIEDRAENLAKSGVKFDVVCARAVAELSLLWSLAEPLLSQGGVLLALKGKNAKAEADALCKKTGFRCVLFPYVLPGTNVLRHVVMVEGD